MIFFFFNGGGVSNFVCDLEDRRKWVKVKVKATQSWPILCDPMDCTVHGTLQARTLRG